MYAWGLTLRTAVLVIVVVFLAFQAIGQAAPPAGSERGPADSKTPDHPAAAVHNHSVKLSWAASVPASKLPRDKVIGYNIYRSTKSHDRHPQRINAKLCEGTSYTDTDVKAGKTYFYVTRGVTASGAESGPSNEVKAKVLSHD